MTTNKGRLHAGMKAALLCGVAGMLLAPQLGIAQTAATEPAPPAQQTEGGQKAEGKPAEQIQELVIVGSRIRRDNFNSPSPIQVITRQETTLAGLASPADILQGNAVTGGSQQIDSTFGGFVVDGGPGANSVSLRGLGAGRTLVLINGRRVTPAGTRGVVISADLNVLPNAMIERIDVLRDGASSIYGSDAVAGVINVITRTDVDGVIVEGQVNRPFAKGGERGRASVVAGTSGDNWKIAGSIEHYNQGEIRVGDRSWASDCPTDFQFDRSTGQRIDYIDPLTGQPKCWSLDAGGVTINTLGTRSLAGVGAPGSVGTSFNRWRPNAAIGTGLVGYEGVGGGANSLNVRDTFDPRTLNESLVFPIQITSGFLQASYELDALGDAEVYTELLGTRRDSQQTGFRQLSLDYPQTSPLVPTSLQAAGTNFGSQLHTGSGLRAFIGFGNDRSEQRVDYYKTNLGIRGDLTFLPEWRYDIIGSYAKSDGAYTFDSFLIDKVRNSVNVVTATAGVAQNLTRVAANGTRVMCGITATNPGEGCIPAPILNSQTLAGVLPNDYRDYIFRPVRGTTEFTEKMFGVNLDGPVFELPAGDVSLALGLEYRKQEFTDTPDINSQTGNLLNFTSSAPTNGEDSVLEIFGEVDVPILKDLPFADALDLTASLRWTEYDSYGSDWTYKVGGSYSPVEWLTARATYGTSYRAPALSEQFQGATSGFLSSNSDPCNDYGVNTNPTRRANCAQELPGQPTFRATSGIQVLSQGGAATGLFAETSDNYTIGGIFQPELPDGFGEFDFAVDYFSIEINDGVERAGATNILTLCYNDPQFRAGGGLCNLVSRTPGSNQLVVIDSFTNIATQVSKGFDYTLRWTGDVGPGSLRINAELTRYSSQAFKNFPTDPLEEVNGILRNPEMVANMQVRYKWTEWTFRYAMEWVDATSSYDYYEEDPATSQFVLETDDYYTHDFSVQYEQEDDWSVTVGVRNLFDEKPPLISNGVINTIGNAPLYSGYDPYGREVFVNVTKTF